MSVSHTDDPRYQQTLQELAAADSEYERQNNVNHSFFESTDVHHTQASIEGEHDAALSPPALYAEYNTTFNSASGEDDEAYEEETPIASHVSLFADELTVAYAPALALSPKSRDVSETNCTRKNCH